MESASYVGLSRQVALQRELEVVANNVANLGTTGFKSEQVLFEEYLSSPSNPVGRSGPGLSYVQDRGTWHDFAPGPTLTTGNPLDVAIDGSGYFAVQTTNGERYTRNGAFQINAQGNLVTSEGDTVLGTAGPVVFNPDDGEVTIGRDGTISTAQGLRGKLRIVRFDSEQALQKEGNSLFSSASPPVEAGARDVRLVQGALEKSNVQPVLELNRLLELSRSYTQLSTMLSQNDDLRRTAIDRLADVSA